MPKFMSRFSKKKFTGTEITMLHFKDTHFVLAVLFVNLLMLQRCVISLFVGK